VTSETSITATAPAGSAGASVPLAVTTAAGTASSAFSYASAVPIAPVPPASCKVPNSRARS
jgi:hypothetical protein